MEARGSADPKVDNQDDPDKDSQGQDKDQVEKKGSPTAAALKEGQKEVMDHPQGEIGEVDDSPSEIDRFHSEEQRQRRYQALADGTKAVWKRADDLLIISKAEIQAAEPPRTFAHAESYTQMTT